MAQLSREQLAKIEEYLDYQDLTFKPFREEIRDHMICDIKDHINKGNTYHEAWNTVLNNVADNHLKILEKQVMDVSNTGFKVSKAFTYLSLLLLLVVSVMKLLHLSLSGILLLATFGAISASLLSGTLFGLYFHKEKWGGLMALGVIVGIVLYLITFGFQVLHLPQFVVPRIIAVTLLIILFTTISIYSNGKKNKDFLLVYLHQRSSSTIEFYLIILFILGVSLKMISIVVESKPDVPSVFLMLTLAGTGIHYFALNLYQPTPDHVGHSAWMQIGLLLSFLCFVLPTVNSSLYSPMLPGQANLVLTTTFMLASGLIVVYQCHEFRNKMIFNLLLVAIFAFHIAWVLINLNVLDPIVNPMIFNLPVLLLLLGGLVYFLKHQLIKVYMIMVIAHYMFNYPNQLGLW